MLRDNYNKFGKQVNVYNSCRFDFVSMDVLTSELTMFQLFEEQEFCSLWETVVPENAPLLVGQFRLIEARSDDG